MFRKSRAAIIAVLCLSALAALAGCGGSKDADNNILGLSGSITVVGSTAIQPLAEQAAADFMTNNPYVRITVQGGGSGVGLTQVAQGAASIGNSDIFADEKGGIDASQLVDHQVAVVGIAVVINPAIEIDSLTKQQLVDIFTGRTVNWSSIGGPDQEIVLINRPKASGTRATFKKYALGGAEEAAGIEEDASGTVRKIIKETPGAIGYLALSYLDGSIKVVNINGLEPTKENIVTGQYPVWAYLHCYTKGQPSAAVEAFLNYLISDEVQKTIVPQLGYIPETEMKIVRDKNGDIKDK